MSAFMVSKAHIDALVCVASGHGITYTVKDDSKPWGFSMKDPRHNLDALGQMLVDENVRSVGYRYGDSDFTDLPGPVNAYWVIPYRWNPNLGRRQPTPVEAIKLARCYEYQSCETDDWEETEACRFIKALIADMISKLPGYEQAPWCWEDRQTAEVSSASD